MNLNLFLNLIKGEGAAALHLPDLPDSIFTKTSNKYQMGTYIDIDGL